MVNKSRTAIYEYVCSLLRSVTDNVYAMYEPQELTDSDRTDGFVTVYVDDIYDESEFDLNAFGDARVFVTAYVPPKSRGRLDTTKYNYFQNGIDESVQSEIDNPTSGIYYIQSDGILSTNDIEDSNADNVFHLYIKSFIVTIDGEITSSSSSN